MSLWVDDSQLFLYNTFAGPAQIWKCKNMNAAVPLKETDFETNKTTVRSHLDLVGASSSWSKIYYDRLLSYITINHLLVNCKGEMFAENYPFDINRQPNRSTVMYLRVYDAMKMGDYGFPVPPKVDLIKLPIKKVKYLDSNREAEMMP